MSNEYLTEGLEMISDLRTEILDRLAEMETIISDISHTTGKSLILTRAKSYWLAHVRGALDPDEIPTSMTTLSDTIAEIADEI